MTHCVMVQSEEGSRWHRRKHWLAAVHHVSVERSTRRLRSAEAETSSNKPLKQQPPPLIDGLHPDVVSVLLDRRLLVCRGHLVASVIVGFATSFLHECCEDSLCPTVQPFDEDEHGGEYDSDDQGDEDSWVESDDGGAD